MASKNKRDVDLEVDLHGLTAEQLRHELQRHWSKWRLLRSVRVIHGQGTTLKPEIARWCSEMGVAYQADAHNAGAVRIYPLERVLPDVSLAPNLRERGLKLSPEQEEYLRDPLRVEQRAEEERKRKAAETARAQANAAADEAKRRRDEALWQSEMARLGVIERKNTEKPDPTSIRPPIIVPPIELIFEEGYWKAELSRVADTDTETLQVQKRTGLDKLAPPMKEQIAVPLPGPSKPQQRQRDTEADMALFEAEMARLESMDAPHLRRK